MYYELDWYKVTLAGIPCMVAPCGYVEYDTYKDELPDGLHLYHIRHSDDDFDYPSTIEKFVCVNHYGLLLTPTELEIPVKGYIDLGHDDAERIYDVITSSNPVSDPLSYMAAGSPAIIGIYEMWDDLTTAQRKAAIAWVLTNIEVEQTVFNRCEPDLHMRGDNPPRVYPGAVIESSDDVLSFFCIECDDWVDIEACIGDLAVIEHYLTYHSSEV